MCGLNFVFFYSPPTAPIPLISRLFAFWMGMFEKSDDPAGLINRKMKKKSFVVKLCGLYFFYSPPTAPIPLISRLAGSQQEQGEISRLAIVLKMQGKNYPQIKCHFFHEFLILEVPPKKILAIIFLFFSRKIQSCCCEEEQYDHRNHNHHQQARAINNIHCR